jgi:hypothetical protein
MKKFIKIESKGLIDPRAFTLVGGSTKRDDSSKIGFFGSGLKYSLAFLLRNKIEFKVYADYNEIIFAKHQEQFRDKVFDVISVNGKISDLTTDMGIDWENWFVIRELVCNAIDEGDSKVSIVTEQECIPVEDKTVFYVLINDRFEEIIKNWDNYFSEKRDDVLYYDLEENKIFNNLNNCLIVYRKGIRCFFYDKQKSCFNYDLSWVDINESRVIKSDFDFRWRLRIYLQKITDKKIITHLLNTINDCWERTFNWEYGSDFSDAWVKVIGKKVLVPVENAGFWAEIMKENPERFLILPSSMCTGLKQRFTDKIRIVGDVDGTDTKGEFRVLEELSKKQNFLLNEAIEFLKKANYEIKYPVKVVEFASSNKLGQASQSTILLSCKLFDLGKKELVSTIIEEQEHLVTGYPDESRAFQNHFIMKMVSLMEDLTGSYL